VALPGISTPWQDDSDGASARGEKEQASCDDWVKEREWSYCGPR
jgi:hypothetical protein